jgi:hypothetical protein
MPAPVGGPVSTRPNAVSTSDPLSTPPPGSGTEGASDSVRSRVEPHSSATMTA